MKKLKYVFNILVENRKWQVVLQFLTYTILQYMFSKQYKLAKNNYWKSWLWGTRVRAKAKDCITTKRSSSTAGNYQYIDQCILLNIFGCLKEFAISRFITVWLLWKKSDKQNDDLRKISSNYNDSLSVFRKRWNSFYILFSSWDIVKI